LRLIIVVLVIPLHPGIFPQGQDVIDILVGEDAAPISSTKN